MASVPVQVQCLSSLPPAWKKSKRHPELTAVNMYGGQAGPAEAAGLGRCNQHCCFTGAKRTEHSAAPTAQVSAAQAPASQALAAQVVSVSMSGCAPEEDLE